MLSEAKAMLAEGRLQPAGMRQAAGGEGEIWRDGKARGDKRCWMYQEATLFRRS